MIWFGNATDWQPSSSGLTQLDVLLWEHSKSQLTLTKPQSSLWKLWNRITCAFGQVRRTKMIRNAVVVIRKEQKSGSLSGLQKSYTYSSRVVSPDEIKIESVTETNYVVSFITNKYKCDLRLCERKKNKNKWKKSIKRRSKNSGKNGNHVPDFAPLTDEKKKKANTKAY